MRARDALKLHKGDKVRLKSGKVIKLSQCATSQGQYDIYSKQTYWYVILYGRNEFLTFTHLEAVGKVT